MMNLGFSFACGDFFCFFVGSITTTTRVLEKSKTHSKTRSFGRSSLTHTYYYARPHNNTDVSTGRRTSLSNCRRPAASRRGRQKRCQPTVDTQRNDQVWETQPRRRSSAKRVCETTRGVLLRHARRRASAQHEQNLSQTQLRLSHGAASQLAIGGRPLFVRRRVASLISVIRYWHIRIYPRQLDAIVISITTAGIIKTCGRGSHA